MTTTRYNLGQFWLGPRGPSTLINVGFSWCIQMFISPLPGNDLNNGWGVGVGGRLLGVPTSLAGIVDALALI